MKTFEAHAVVRIVLVAGPLLASPSWPPTAAAQETTPGPSTHNHAAQPTDATDDFEAQLRGLKAKVATLQQNYPGAVSTDTSDGKGMGVGKGVGVGMMGKGKDTMGGGTGADSDELTETMKKMRSMMEMKMKNKMGGMGGSTSDMQGEDMAAMSGKRMGMSGMQTPSPLPGFPGASHIYHIGATGFFLDYAEHIPLTVDQEKQLGEIKVQSLSNQATLEGKIEQAEQDLMELTSSEAPDAGKVEYRAREIGQLQSEQRVAFIRDVGRAASVLTDEQRQRLTGMIESNPAPQAQPPQPPKPAAMPGMPGM